MFLAVLDVVQAKRLGQLQGGIDLQVVGLEQVLEVAGSRQRVVLRRVVQAAIGEHQLQALELQ
ncbi:hypothetical protein D3C75_1186320 [compost metagenome]